MPAIHDGPRTALFAPLPFQGNTSLSELREAGISPEMAAVLEQAPFGDCTGWGIAFRVGDVVLIKDRPVTIELPATKAPWLIFMHTSDFRPLEPGRDGFYAPMRGKGQLGEQAAKYVLLYQDGCEAPVAIRRRFQVGSFHLSRGESAFGAVPHTKPYPVRASHEQLNPDWGRSQGRAMAADTMPWVNWLWAWENPHPEKALAGIRFEPESGTVIVSGISAGHASSHPLRWLSRRKACLTLPCGEAFQPELSQEGLLKQVQLDMGQVISATPRLVYPKEGWPATYNNQVPETSERQVLLEYTAHADASFHLSSGEVVPVAWLYGSVPERDGSVPDKPAGPARRSRDLPATEGAAPGNPLQPVPAATQRVRLKAIETASGKPVPVKLHVHGTWGEYLAPVDRHRIPNPAWFEDYSVDFAHQETHACTYIPGETTLDLPLGRVYVEMSKGFEVRPVRKVVEVTPDTREIVVQLEQVLPWRERSWVTADTHVHFLSPMSALLEGSAEGVNVVNLLASQWGEMMSNVGDFDGRTTWGSREAGGDGEYLVRVGTENRQHRLGHISLLGYRGGIIAPMTTGGPHESAIGDPIEILLTEWARQCKAQGGVTVLPHFPNPRGEWAASIVSEEIDAVEMTSWGNLYGGIDPYSLSDWYRYLNCGYLVAAVGGTDKMEASTPVGAVRTYARLAPGEPFTYDAWMEAVRRAETFVTYGPLLEFAVEGQPMGSRMGMRRSGGTVDVTWEAASVTVPMTRVELVVNGEIRESVAVDPEQAAGSWAVKVKESAWLALLVRGRYEDKPEMIAAHSSPVMIDVEGSPMMAAADAITILEQIEGALAYLDTVGTRAEETAYRRMRLVLTSAHRSLHNRMHQLGYYHDHTVAEDHGEHH